MATTWAENLLSSPGLKVCRVATVEDLALSNVPGLFDYSFTVSPVAVIEPDIYGLNNETTERRADYGC